MEDISRFRYPPLSTALSLLRGPPNLKTQVAFRFFEIPAYLIPTYEDPTPYMKKKKKRRTKRKSLQPEASASNREQTENLLPPIADQTSSLKDDQSAKKTLSLSTLVSVLEEEKKTEAVVQEQVELKVSDEFLRAEKRLARTLNEARNKMAERFPEHFSSEHCLHVDYEPDTVLYVFR